MEIKACRSYHGVLDGFRLLSFPDGKSVFKIYYVSIIGRDRPEQYEWAKCPLSKADYERSLLDKPLEGIGFVTAFPHITKVFRFSPEVEIVLDVAAFDTSGLASRSLSRKEGFMEFACYAEAVLAADEYHAWAKSETTKAYLDFRSPSIDFPVRSNTKLGTYWA
jgi:hypothetical protein